MLNVKYPSVRSNFLVVKTEIDKMSKMHPEWKANDPFVRFITNMSTDIKKDGFSPPLYVVWVLILKYFSFSHPIASHPIPLRRFYHYHPSHQTNTLTQPPPPSLSSFSSRVSELVRE